MTCLSTQREPSDEDLVALALVAGAEEFSKIVRRYQDAVFGVALSRLGNFHDAEDLAQATFLEAYVGLERLRDSSRLGPWLRTIAIHRSINHLKGRKHWVEFEATDEPAAEEPSPLEEAEASDLRRQVLALVERLGKTHRETVLLYYIGDHSIAEVASIQEVPEGTVKRRLHEARTQLKEGMLDMVEEVLHDSAPGDAFADRIYEVIAAYPPGEVTGSQETREIVARFGRMGKDGFVRAYQLPHAHSRLRAVQFVGRYYGNRFGGDGPPQEFSVQLLIEALQDSNRRVRQAAADRLLFQKGVMSDHDWVRDVLPHLLGLLTHESKHTRKMAVGKIDIWVRWSGTSRETVLGALSLEDICRPMAQETDEEVLWRYRYLVGHYLEVQDGI